MDNEERTDSPTTPIPPECAEVCVHFGYPHGTRVIREGVSEEPQIEDTTYGDGDVIATFHKVTFVNVEGDAVTADIRIVAEEFSQLVEFAYACGTCETVNWIGVGLDPGEYRCASCALWLT
jgi:hypothetical protein